MDLSHPRSYEIIGSKEGAVAIVEIPDDLKKKERQIAKEILKKHKHVKTVLKKFSERKGKYRVRKFKLLAGVRNTEVVHKESGCLFKLNPQKVYFSAREGTERLRIAQRVKPNETVMVMFSGVCPFSIQIAKHQPRIKKVISIEINPAAYEYAKENVLLNKVVDKIVPILGDVKKKCKEWYGKCDRVLMPLPHKAENYLNIALKCLKPKGGIIHLYLIESEEKIKTHAEKIMKKIKKKPSYAIRKVLPYAPRVNKYCIDIKFSR